MAVRCLGSVSIERATRLPRSKREAQRIDGVVDDTHRSRLCFLPNSDVGDTALVGVNSIVEENDLEVEVAPDGVHKMMPPIEGITIAGDYPDAQLRVGGLDARGQRRRASCIP